MKSNRAAIVVMIMLGFVEILSVVAANTCPIQCSLLCGSGPTFWKCYDKCIAKCNKVPVSAYNCITKCGVNKTVTVTVGNYFLMKFIFTFVNVFIVYNSTDLPFHLIYNGFYVSDDRGHVTDVIDSCLQNCPSLEE
ncbi:hypothetical protein V8G54_024413 [Vigna mungo]|uniref:Uncharacterized protein n=1 Tax=Vigna mungo TaxID=3915 RepID=A0AAQ3N6X4_VIGMU